MYLSSDGNVVCIESDNHKSKNLHNVVDTPVSFFHIFLFLCTLHILFSQTLLFLLFLLHYNPICTILHHHLLLPIPIPILCHYHLLLHPLRRHHHPMPILSFRFLHHNLFPCPWELFWRLCYLYQCCSSWPCLIRWNGHAHSLVC